MYKFTNIMQRFCFLTRNCTYVDWCQSFYYSKIQSRRHYYSTIRPIKWTQLKSIQCTLQLNAYFEKKHSTIESKMFYLFESVNYRVKFNLY